MTVSDILLTAASQVLMPVSRVGRTASHSTRGTLWRSQASGRRPDQAASVEDGRRRSLGGGNRWGEMLAVKGTRYEGFENVTS